MDLKLRVVILFLCAIVLGVFVNGYSQGRSDKKGSTMFTFLLGKKPGPSSVAPEVGATLQRESTLPQHVSSPAKPSFPECRIEYICGNPPEAQWVADEVPGETRQVFVIPASGATPSLAILSHRGEGYQKVVQVWELSAEKPARFVRQRPVVLPPELSASTYTFPEVVLCLPRQQAAISVGYETPNPRDALLIYDTENNLFRYINRIAPEFTGILPLKFIESIHPTPETLLLLYHTKAIRVAPENYAYENDHILLFSPRFPQGLEIVTLSIGDGNVRAWGMQGKTLWLQTLDKRKKPQGFLWSLDLSNVL